MGEYIKYRGQEIKLGTCESMYYARLDQLKETRFEMDKMGGNLDISEYLNPKNGFRYRFPFPEEDSIQIGNFEEYDKGLVIQLHPDDYSIAEFDHYDIWSECHPQGGGYNVNVNHPCPQSPKIDDFKHSPITWRIIAIKQQKQVDGEIWVVIGCPYCGTLARLPHDDAVKLAHSIEVGYINQHDQTDSNKVYYTEVVKRIMAGYTKVAAS